MSNLTATALMQQAMQQAQMKVRAEILGIRFEPIINQEQLLLLLTEEEETPV